MWVRLTTGRSARFADRPPAVEHPLGHLLGGQGERPMVAPRPVDVQVGAPHPLVAEPELVHHPQARGVLRPDVDLQPVQTDPPEAVVGAQGQGRWHDPVPGDAAVDPVTDVRRAQRTPGDSPHRELPDESSFIRHDEGKHPAGPGLRTEKTHHGPKPDVRAAAPRRRGLPGREPARVDAAHVGPGGAIAVADRPEPHLPLREGGRPPAAQWSPPWI